MTAESSALTQELRSGVRGLSSPLPWIGAALFAALVFYYSQNPLGGTIVYDDDPTYEIPDNRLNPDYADRTFVDKWNDPDNPQCPGSADGEHNWQMNKDYIWTCDNAGCPLAWDPKIHPR